MRKKLLTIMFALLMCFSTFVLTACGGGSASGGGSGGGSGSGGSGGSSVEEPPSGDNDTDSSDIGDFFSGYRVLINGDDEFEIKDELTGGKVTFNALLNRQITTLAQDILYRLYLVYGGVAKAEITDEAEAITELYMTTSANKLVFDDTAVIDKREMLTKEAVHLNSHVREHIDCIYCYQQSLTGTDNYLNNTAGIILTNAIIGHYFYYDGRDLLVPTAQVQYDSNGDNNITAEDAYRNAYDPTEYKWLMNDLTKYSAAVSNAIDNSDTTSYLNKVKMAIAKMIVGDDYLIDTYNYNDYLNTLSRINRLGFYVTPETGALEGYVYDDQKMLDYINKKIIGETNINRDQGYYELFEESEKVSLQNWSDAANIPQHFYKGYNIVVPNIVKMAFANTFTTSDDTIYPICARTNIYDRGFEPKEGSESEYETTGPCDFSAIILKPISGSLPADIILSIAVARDSDLGDAPGDITDTRYIKDIYVKFKVNFEYKTVNGEGFNAVVPAKEEELELTVDSAGWPGTADYPADGYVPFQFSFSISDYLGNNVPTLGEYNGDNNTVDDMTLWNNAFKANETNSAFNFNAGDNYVQVTLVDVVVYKRETSGDVIYTGNDVVYDVSLLPLTM